MSTLFEAKYWNRVWVQQEMVLARQFIVMALVEDDLGCMLLWEELVQHASDIFQQALSTLLHEKERITGAFNKLEYLCEFIGSGLLGEGMELDEALSRFKECQYSNPRDKVYGILGVVKPSQHIEVDYQLPVSTVWEDVFRQGISSHQAHIQAEEVSFIALKIGLAGHIGDELTGQLILSLQAEVRAGRLNPCKPTRNTRVRPERTVNGLIVSKMRREPRSRAAVLEPILDDYLHGARSTEFKLVSEALRLDPAQKNAHAIASPAQYLLRISMIVVLVASFAYLILDLRR